MKLIGVDVGGTFTDIVFTDTEVNRTIIHKVPTTPGDPSDGVMSGLAELCERNHIDRATIDHVLHDTTIATNAVLEHKGARTGMVTTKGYRDILHIGRHQRPSTTRSCRRSRGRTGRWCEPYAAAPPAWEGPRRSPWAEGVPTPGPSSFTPTPTLAVERGRLTRLRHPGSPGSRATKSAISQLT